MNFVGIEILAWLLVALVSICTCGLGALVAVPVSSFYLQNAAYHKGLIS
jgi:multisubunit Na+/H+ antiporter MnhG subunit